jgi:uncharacterized damage-inducible protein DinB
MIITKQGLIGVIEKESATTLRVMRAYPADAHDFKPHDRSNDAMQLMKTFVFELWLLGSNLMGEEHKPEDFKTYAPGDVATVIGDFEKLSKEFLAKLSAMPDADYEKAFEAFGRQWTGADEFALMMLFDQIHHRGQLSVYVRMAGGLVPAIYGPSADDPGTNL